MSSVDLSVLDQRLRSFSNRIFNEIRKIEANSFRQYEAREALRLRMGSIEIPYTRGWAASPDFLVFLFDLVLTSKPLMVVELGSGVSTLVVAEALRRVGRGKLYTVDHDEHYMALTRASVERAQLADFVDFRHAPLRPWLDTSSRRMGQSWQWYDTSCLPTDDGTIDMLIVDGPPALTGPLARYPALPTFRHSLSDHASVVMDDASREEERRISWFWTTLGMDISFYDDFEKGIAVLRPLTAGAQPVVTPDDVSSAMSKAERWRNLVAAKIEDHVFHDTDEDRSLDYVAILHDLDAALAYAKDATATGLPAALKQAAQMLEKHSYAFRHDAMPQ